MTNSIIFFHTFLFSDTEHKGDIYNKYKTDSKLKHETQDAIDKQKLDTSKDFNTKQPGLLRIDCSSSLYLYYRKQSLDF